MKSIHTPAHSSSSSRSVATLGHRFASTSPAPAAWLALAALIVLLTGSVAHWRSSRVTPAEVPAAVTLPAQIQDQVRGLAGATSLEEATTNATTLGVEDIYTLPQQIQEQVRLSVTGHTMDALAQDRALRPEMISTLPWQIQEQLRGKQAGTATAARHRPEYVVTLPWQIQDQVRGLSQERVASAKASASSLLSPEDIISLPPQIHDQVRRSRGLAATQPAQGSRPEWIVTLPPQIQDQVRGTPGGASR